MLGEGTTMATGSPLLESGEGLGVRAVVPQGADAHHGGDPCAPGAELSQNGDDRGVSLYRSLDHRLPPVYPWADHRVVLPQPHGIPGRQVAGLDRARQLPRVGPRQSFLAIHEGDDNLRRLQRAAYADPLLSGGADDEPEDLLRRLLAHHLLSAESRAARRRHLALALAAQSELWAGQRHARPVRH